MNYKLNLKKSYLNQRKKSIIFKKIKNKANMNRKINKYK